MKTLSLLLFIISFDLFARIETTNSPTDFMLVGDASYAVINSDNSLSYTRDGSFLFNKQGYIIDTFGRKLHPGLKITHDTASLDVNSQGLVIGYDKSSNPHHIGQITLFRKNNKGQYTEITSKSSDISIHQGKVYIPESKK